MQKRAFIYARISQDRTGANMGVDRQVEDCRALAETLGMEVIEVFVDNDISASAYSKKQRPSYNAMMARLSEVSAVLIWHSDRLHRRPIELEHYVDLVRTHGVATHAHKGGEIRLDTPEGLLQAGLMGQLARYESAHNSDKIKRKHEQSAMLGTWRGGARPFGWKPVDGSLILDETEAGMVREAMHKVLAGGSLGSIVTEWNAAGVPTTGKGSQWTYATLRQLLLRPSNAGFSVLRGEIVGRLQADPIVSEDVWRAVSSVLQDPARRRSQTNKARHLLAGIAQCHCGLPVRSGTVRGRNGRSYFVYRCPAKGTGHVGKKTSYLDSLADEYAVLIRRMAVDGEMPVAIGAEQEVLRAELNAKRQRLDDVAIEFAKGGITLRQLSVITETLTESISTMESQMAELQLVGSRPKASQLMPDQSPLDTPEAAEWLALPLDERRDYLRSRLNFILLPHTKGSPRVFDRGTVVAVANPHHGLLSSKEIEQILGALDPDDGSPYRLVIKNS